MSNPYTSLPATLQAVLADEGYEVVIVRKMFDAWDVVLQQGDEIVAVVINFLRDTTLSDFDLACAIRERPVPKKVILFTPMSRSSIASDPHMVYFDGVMYHDSDAAEMAVELRRILA
ncbi:MAG: hypothetical protein WAP52_04170 [Candidatus Sungiibacteriota bacterium]